VNVTYNPVYSRRYHAEGVRRLISVAETAAHVRSFTAAGFVLWPVARAAGTSPAALSKVLRDAPGQCVSRYLAGNVQAVTFGAAYAAARDGEQVPIVGAARRLQALLRAGHRHADLSAAYGVLTGQVLVHARAGRLGVEARTWRAVRDLYADLWNVPGPSDTTRRRARASGYLDAWAWDDDEIDLPWATPHQPASYAFGRVEEALRLWGSGETVEQSCARTGVDPSSMWRHLQRHGTPLQQALFADARETERAARTTLRDDLEDAS